MTASTTDDTTNGPDPGRLITPAGFQAAKQDRPWRELDRALRTR